MPCRGARGGGGEESVIARRAIGGDALCQASSVRRSRRRARGVRRVACGGAASNFIVSSQSVTADASLTAQTSSNMT